MNPTDNDAFAGLPVDAIEHALTAGGMAVTRTGNGLIGRQGKIITHISFEQPEDPDSENGDIRAVLTVKSELPVELAPLFEKPGSLAAFSRYATLAAPVLEEGIPVLGSRITLYEAEDALNIQVPLIVATALMAPQVMLDTIRHVLAGMGDKRPKESAWGERDFARAHQYLSRMSVCTADAGGLTAEFGLRQNSLLAITGDHHTALWRMFADQPHPEAGGGLLCCLEMPHRTGDEAALPTVLARLNAMEMAPLDRPPHFGAWCPGTLGDNPAYVSFLPNFLHGVGGIAVNLSFWAYGRAQWADAMLPSLGLRA